MGKVGPKYLQTSLMNVGFRSSGGEMWHDSAAVKAICRVEVSRKNYLPSVNLGFWLYELGTVSATSYNHCHIYGPVSFVIPVFADYALLNGVNDESAWKSFGHDASLLFAEVDKLMTVSALRLAFHEGKFDSCLIRKEARALLELPGSVYVPSGK